MDNGYRAIKESEAFHYATPTEKVVEHALDATANAPDEWATISKKETVEVVSSKMETTTHEYYDGDTKKQCHLIESEPDTYGNVIIKSRRGEYEVRQRGDLRPIETQSQIEEREREEFTLKMVKDCIDYNFGDNLTARDARQIYDWLKSTDQLKDKSDD